MWVKPYLRRHREQGCYANLMRELALEDAEAYRSWIRMDTGTFEELLRKVTPLIMKQDTSFREAIPAGERLAITLRYLATAQLPNSSKTAPFVIVGDEGFGMKPYKMRPFPASELEDAERIFNYRQPDDAKAVREVFRNYFMNEGQVSCQWKLLE
ncbi:hypothetical protein HPB47_005979 [Ixodes persulcatus]|uniref:Uncharacterized protein n=1 Tax=Ixodes persulcatus TaxID=34615 RepID=A0AC60PBX3_IXOPE|nr:hypothetical protein HPB47_005979 [Ixodes persulcatus]